MEAPAVALAAYAALVLASHGLLGGQRSAAGVRGRDGDGLELEEREGGAVVRDADEGERRVGDVEDVFVEVVRLRTVRDEDVRTGGRDGRGVVVQGGEEGVGAVVAGAEEDAVDVTEQSPVLELDSTWDGLLFLKTFCWSIAGLLLEGNIAEVLNRTYPLDFPRQEAFGQVKQTTARDLIDFFRERTDLPCNVSGGSASSNKKEILSFKSLSAFSG